MDMLAMQVLIDRDNVSWPPGTCYQFTYVHPRAYEDTPVVEYARSEVRRKVAEAAQVDPDNVTLAEVSPDELVAAWKAHDPMSPPPVNAHALVGWHTPERSG